MLREIHFQHLHESLFRDDVHCAGDSRRCWKKVETVSPSKTRKISRDRERIYCRTVTICGTRTKFSFIRYSDDNEQGDFNKDLSAQRQRCEAKWWGNLFRSSTHMRNMTPWLYKLGVVVIMAGALWWEASHLLQFCPKLQRSLCCPVCTPVTRSTHLFY